MDAFVEWLRAQLDEDDRIAREAKAGPWHSDGGSVYARHPTDEVVRYSESAEHIAGHDPVRVLREVEAKRQLLAQYAEVADNDVDEVEYAHGWANALGTAVRLLALPYADRPGYREEWRP
jgi:hypothetical protein